MTTEGVTNTLAIPAPTAWPIVLAFGTALLFAGLVTSAPVSVLGAMLMIAAAVGWFRDVLPHEAHEVVPVQPELPAPVTSRRKVARFPIPGELPRAWLPLEVYPISAGIKGGLAGSVAMAVLAMLYGLLSQRSIWYPINLLAGGLFSGRGGGRHGAARRIPSRGVPRGRPDPPPDVAAGRGALRSDVADAAAAADSARRLHRAADVVRAPLQRARHHQSGAQSTDQLALVRAVAGRIRN